MKIRDIVSVLLIIVICTFTLSTIATAIPISIFNDLAGNEWFYKQVERLVDIGSVSGYQDGSFRPNKEVTRAEFTKMLVSALGYNNLERSSKHWASGYMDKAIEINLVSKGQINYIDRDISRNEMAKMTSKALEYLGEPQVKNISSYKYSIKDFNSISSEYKEYVLKAYSKGILIGYGDGKFKGDRGLTRAEASSVILRILDENERIKHSQPIPVLMYHHILTQEEITTYGWSNNNSVISVESFAKQMKYLKDNDYHIASLPELEKYINEGEKLPEKSVAITFDDGYLSNAKYAYPIMKEYGFRGTIFMVGNTCTKEEKEFSPIGTQHITVPSFHKYRDVFDFGCHTFNMHHTRYGKPLVYSLGEREIRGDLLENKKHIDSTYIAYPYGAYNKTLLKVIDELGYTMGFTVENGYANKNTPIYEIPRFGIGPNTSLEDFIEIIDIM